MDTDPYTRENYIYELFDRMKHDPEYRPTVKNGAVEGDAECIEAMVLWNNHVKNMRRLYAGR